ncbi:hypothetical protein PsorP6_004924 [Peronosclerospora sorghi]|uniref:Uncharacterized protein n=1 Tax=Peronosclerospora sorghi TaxID=230839 RepID=A0ACC0W5V9_9STRA|nr:hypothetical protein PsorP6_004924 [Peronosclerospora sorghi]
MGQSHKEEHQIEGGSRGEAVEQCSSMHVATQREDQRVAKSACIECPLPVELVAKFLGYLRFSPQWHVSMPIASRADENAAFQALE